MFSRLCLSNRLAVRSLATAAAAGKHQPPKKIYGTIGRYAEAIYVSASKAGALEKVENELKAFTAIFKKHPAFAAFLANPTIARSEKVEKIGGLIEEGKITHITRNLFLTLSANGRIGEVSKVIAAYEDLMNTSRGLVHATIVSAAPLEQKTLDSLKVAVQKIAGAGKTVEVKVEVDAKILGGLKVIVGDRFIDLSVASRVQELTGTLESASL